MRWSGRPAAVLLAGFLVMVAATIWAPQQPELISTDHACQFAPCGSLEDPARWRAAWGLWCLGFAAMLGALPFLVVPLKRIPPARLLLVLVATPFWVLAILVIAVLVALVTSVHGAATVVAGGLVAPLVALGSAFFKGADAMPFGPRSG